MPTPATHPFILNFHSSSKEGGTSPFLNMFHAHTLKKGQFLFGIKVKVA